jgi:RNA polymerase sigma factor (sigma-70 family)
VFTVFYAHFFDRFHRWFVSFGADYHRGFDLAGEIMLICWRTRLRGYDPGYRPPQVYLGTMAHNLYVTRCCRGRRNTTPMKALPHDIQAKDNVLNEVALHELETVVQSAMKSLSARERTLIEAVMEGHDYETLAELMQISVKAARSMLHRVREKMKALMRVQMPATNLGRPRKEPGANQAHEQGVRGQAEEGKQKR